MDIDFRSTRNDNLEPRGMRGGVGQSPQDAWTSETVAILINCVDNKDESTFGRARKFADERKEKKRVLYRRWHQIWIVTQAFYHEASKRGEYYREFVDESGQDISGFARISVIPPAENSASKMISFVKAGTNRMSQRRFPDHWQAIDPVYIALLLP